MRALEQKVLCLLLLALAHCFAGAFAQERSPDPAVEITRMVAELKAERPDTIESWLNRIRAAKRLSDYFRSLSGFDTSSLPPHIIDEVAGLLSDKDPTVQSYAAPILGGMGPLASRAVPALEKALDRVALGPGTGIFQTGPNSEPAIRQALESITGADMTPDPDRESAGSWELRNR